MLRLRNEITGTLETLQPVRPGQVSVYVCGITPYDTTHLGHAFTYLSFDVLIRYLEYRGLSVRYVQNVTDIDDDILRKSGETGEDWLALGNRWTRHFIEDLRTLNVRPPDVFPRATETIPDIIAQVKALVDSGHGYAAGGSVYYAVETHETFGAVSGLDAEQWLPIANERGNVPDDPHKRNPLDFVLWQAQKPGEPAWESPWGPGRPGWHIECSSMSSAFLGDEIDIHGGGADLSFPHHECEAAQMCGVTGRDVFVHHWLHTAMVRYQGEKMSKSLGNLIWARELLQEHTPDAVRLLVTAHPYHETWSYDPAELEPADARAALLAQAARAEGGWRDEPPTDGYVAAFCAAMDDNLDSRSALESLDTLARDILKAATEGRNVQAAQATLRRLGTVFGLTMGGEIEPRVSDGWDAHHARFA